MKIKYLILPVVAMLGSINNGVSAETIQEPCGIFSNVKSRHDHMALPFNAESKESLKEFYGKTLGLKVKEAGAENLLVDFLGTNLVFHTSKDKIPSSNLTSQDNPIPGLHFGAQGLTLNEFLMVEQRLSALNISVGATKILNPGLANEERTLFFRDPIGYVIECRYSMKSLSFDPAVKVVMDSDKIGF